MRDKPSIFYGTLLLAGANIALQGTAMAFRVWLSRRVGAAGLGLLQLVLSVGALARTAGISGARVAALYLCAEELGRGRPGGVRRVLDACIRYTLALGSLAGLCLIAGAGLIAERWIGDPAAVSGLRVLGLFLPAECMCAVLSGWFTASGKIGSLAAVEALERLMSIALSVALLRLYGKNDPGSACAAILLGGGAATLISACIMGVICLRALPRADTSVPSTRRMLRICLPLALGDYVRAGLSTFEHMLIPRGLARSGTADALAAYGTIHGMVFPVILFPTAFLYALVDLLIPELSRSRAMGRTERIRALTDHCLRMGAIFACACAGAMHLLSVPLGRLLYRSEQAGLYIALFAPLAVVLYLDAITDGLLKGLGQQLHTARVNTLSSVLEVAALALLLPRFGVTGYFISFALTRFLNFMLSIARLFKATSYSPDVHFCVKLCLCLGICSALLRARPLLFLPVFFTALLLSGTVNRDDLRWLRGVIRPNRAIPVLTNAEKTV